MSEDKPAQSKELKVGKQKDVSEMAREAGLLIPVFVTSSGWDTWITPDEKSVQDGENEKMRIRHVLDRLLYYIREHRKTSRSNLIYFPVPLKKEGKSEDVQLLSYLGPLEEGSNKPCVTIMLPEDYDDPGLN